MKISIIILTICLCSKFVHGQSYIIRKKEKNYSISYDDNGKTSRKRHEIILYNGQGNIIKKTIFFRELKIEEDTFSYNSNNQINNIISQSYIGEGFTRISSYFYIPSKKYPYQVIISNSNNDLLSLTKNEFDDKDNLIKRLNINVIDTKKIDSYIQYEYNENGQILQEISYSSEHKITDRTIYHYDTLQRLLEVITQEHNRKIFKKIEYLADIEIHKEIVIIDNNSFPSYLSVYDKKKRLLKETTYDEDKKILNEMINFYNDKGEIIKSQRFRYGELEEETFYSYEYF